MSFNRTAAPAAEPLTKAEVKLHAHMETAETIEDGELDIYIKAAREYVENVTQRALITQTFTYFTDCFKDEIKLKANLQSVEAVRYIDRDGNQQTLASSVYVADTDAPIGRIYRDYDQDWPDIRSQRNAVEVDFTVGYGATSAAVPESIRHAMLLLIGHWYMNREAVSVGSLNEVPYGVELLLNPYKIWSF